MQYREAKPLPPIDRYVKCFWSIENGAVPDAGPEPVLPDGCPEIVFNLADRFQQVGKGPAETQPSAIVSGQLKRHILIRPTGRVELFGVRFHPHGAYPFLQIPLTELTDNIVSLDAAIGYDAERLEEMLTEAASFEQRVSIFESHLMKTVSADGSGCRLEAQLSSTVLKFNGRISVNRLGNAYGLSERKLERIFGRSIGLSPKMFTRIVRFQNIVRHVEMAESPDLLDTALSFGYYDQSHMIREFNEFAGKSPLAYFEDTHRISELFTTSV